VANFTTGTAGVVDTVGKLATSVIDTAGNLPLVSMTQATNNEKNTRLLTPESELVGKIYIYTVRSA
jgi:hypothetical protein